MSTSASASRCHAPSTIRFVGLARGRKLRARSHGELRKPDASASANMAVGSWVSSASVPPAATNSSSPTVGPGPPVIAAVGATRTGSDSWDSSSPAGVTVARTPKKPANPNVMTRGSSSSARRRGSDRTSMHVTTSNRGGSSATGSLGASVRSMAPCTAVSSSSRQAKPVLSAGTSSGAGGAGRLPPSASSHPRSIASDSVSSSARDTADRWADRAHRSFHFAHADQPGSRAKWRAISSSISTLLQPPRSSRSS